MVATLLVGDTAGMAGTCQLRPQSRAHRPLGPTPEAMLNKSIAMTALRYVEDCVPTATAVGPFAHWHGIVGASGALRNVIRRIELVSRTRSAVLITGETGTGKELVARAIHDAGARRHTPFVTVNCAAPVNISAGREVDCVEEE